MGSCMNEEKIPAIRPLQDDERRLLETLLDIISSTGGTNFAGSWNRRRHGSWWSTRTTTAASNCTYLMVLRPADDLEFQSRDNFSTTTGSPCGCCST